MDDRAFDALVADLRGAQAPRVWSLLVTIFGDLAQDGSMIGAAVLGRIAAAIGIRPEAMRVALHRLRKDGWIESKRIGRSSVYGLSRKGRAESVAASPRIYDTHPPCGAVWLILRDPAGPPDPSECAGVRITPHMLLSARLADDPDVFATRIEADRALPVWISDKVCDPETCDLSMNLAARLDRLCHALAPEVRLDPLQETVLRVLIVHEWRRIVLKVPRLPDHVFPEGWRGPDCRSRVEVLLARLPRRRPDDVDCGGSA